VEIGQSIANTSNSATNNNFKTYLANPVLPSIFLDHHTQAKFSIRLSL